MTRCQPGLWHRTCSRRRRVARLEFAADGFMRGGDDGPVHRCEEDANRRGKHLHIDLHANIRMSWVRQKNAPSRRTALASTSAASASVMPSISPAHRWAASSPSSSAVHFSMGSSGVTAGDDELRGRGRRYGHGQGWERRVCFRARSHALSSVSTIFDGVLTSIYSRVLSKMLPAVPTCGYAMPCIGDAHHTPPASSEQRHDTPPLGAGERSVD